MIADNPRLYGQNNGFVILKMDSLGYPFFNNRKIEHMVTVKDIYEGTNISDSWCESKIARFNNILASFAIEVYDLYPQKIIERFAPATCKSSITTTYPIAKIWWFYGKWCNVWCSEEPHDCCAGFKRLLMSEMYGNSLDQNAYSYEYPNKVKMTLPTWLTDAFILYSKGYPTVDSLDDEVDIDPYMLALLRLYMKSEYAFEWDNDINAWANYTSRFQTKLKKMQDMYMNQTKWIFPWGSSPASV